MKTMMSITLAIAGFALVGPQKAAAQIPWCPPFCSAKADSKSNNQQAPKAQQHKKQKKQQKQQEAKKDRA
jgi:hypothetical protein